MVGERGSDALAQAVESRLLAWDSARAARRVWERDPGFWPETDPEEIRTRLGWLHPQVEDPEVRRAFHEFAREVRDEGTDEVFLLGMGGSSLAPQVFQGMFGAAPGHPRLTVVDTTHPDLIREVDRRLRSGRALVVVASKTGTTLEPQVLSRHFWRLLEANGERPGRHFVGITDPGTTFAVEARRLGFREVFQAPPDVGGRYAALTVFGLLPAALIGVDLHRLAESARAMIARCGPSVPPEEHPGLQLGAYLAAAHDAGRTKVTFFATPPWTTFPDWIEQLLAESTGKRGKGLLPIVGEPILGAASYRDDRAFVQVGPREDARSRTARTLAQLERDGAPGLEIPSEEIYDVGGEFFRWEFGVAVAASALHVNPFDQPDVDLGKRLTLETMAGGGAAASTVRGLEVGSAPPGAVRAAFEHLLAGTPEPRYVAIQAYLVPGAATDRALTELRRALATRWRVATTVGYAPRSLHSIGQYHKGGPPDGRFVQLLDDPSADLPAQGEPYTLGQILRAQASGDLEALTRARRATLRLELGRDVERNLGAVRDAVDAGA